jgi:hypothetical protein
MVAAAREHVARLTPGVGPSRERGSMDQAMKDLWTAVRKNIPYNPDAGITKYWLEHWKELGSPVGPERRDGEDVYQAFTRGLVRWTPNGPVLL